MQPHFPFGYHPSDRAPHLGFIDLLDDHGAVREPLPERDTAFAAMTALDDEDWLRWNGGAADASLIRARGLPR